MAEHEYGTYTGISCSIDAEFNEILLPISATSDL